MKIRKLGLWSLMAALALTASFGLVACGGDDDDGGSDSGGSSGGTGSDEKYVGDLCKASLVFSKAIDKATSDPSKLSNPSDFSKAFAGPFDEFAKSLSKAKPPKDLKEFHDEMVKSVNDASKAMKSGDPEALSSIGDLPEPPKAAQDRLQKIADKNKDCNEADFSFD